MYINRQAPVYIYYSYNTTILPLKNALTIFLEKGKIGGHITKFATIAAATFVHYWQRQRRLVLIFVPLCH